MVFLETSGVCNDLWETEKTRGRCTVRKAFSDVYHKGRMRGQDFLFSATVFKNLSLNSPCHLERFLGPFQVRGHWKAAQSFQVGALWWSRVFLAQSCLRKEGFVWTGRAPHNPGTEISKPISGQCCWLPNKSPGLSSLPHQESFEIFSKGKRVG